MKYELSAFESGPKNRRTQLGLDYDRTGSNEVKYLSPRLIGDKINNIWPRTKYGEMYMTHDRKFRN
jgi:hypothetical protein